MVILDPWSGSDTLVALPLFNLFQLHNWPMKHKHLFLDCDISIQHTQNAQNSVYAPVFNFHFFRDNCESTLQIKDAELSHKEVKMPKVEAMPLSVVFCDPVFCKCHPMAFKYDEPQGGSHTICLDLYGLIDCLF